MPKAKKAKKAVKEENSEAHKKEHAPDVKKLLEEYEQKEGDSMDEEEFISQHINMDNEDIKD